MKTYGEAVDVSECLFKHQPLHPMENSLRFPPDRRSGGPQGRSERGEEKNILPLLGNQS
jgi:hypothetical protein